MENNPKILFTDLDGTLLTSAKRISDEDLKSIYALVESGHKFVIATGRPFLSAYKLCLEYDFLKEGFYVVASNGGLIYDCGSNKTLLRNSVPYEYVSYIFEKAKEFGLHVQTYSDDHVIALRKTPELIKYTDTIKMPYKIVNNIPDDLEYEPPKVIVICHEGREILTNFRKSLSFWEKGKVQSVFSADILLEYLPVESTKGNGIRKLCELLKIPVLNSIACGDEENDISMIKAAGIGVVMNNGSDLVKSYADYITSRTNDESGISEVIHKFIV